MAKYWDALDTTYHIGDSDIVHPFCVPQYCNRCSTIPGAATVPVNDAFYQYPRTGNGLAYAMMLDDTTVTGDTREQRRYLQGRLMELVADTSYCVSFFTNMAEASTNAINDIGAYLDDGSIDSGKNEANCASPQLSYVPQIYSHTVINDTANWVMVQGRFTASGTEKFITIGNFNTFSSTMKVHVPSGSGGSFYLLDDVSVMPSSTAANAGPDGVVSPGSDSAWIGPHEEGWPCKWYIVGDTGVYSYYTGFKVHPDTTTKYVMELDLCDNVTLDTVTVYAAPAGIHPLTVIGKQEYSVFPQPNNGTFTLRQTLPDKEPETLELMDMMGRVLSKQKVHFSNLTTQIQIPNAVPGVYILRITSEDGQQSLIQVVIQ